MKNNGPCADVGRIAGEGLRKTKGGTPMRKRNKVVSLLLADGRQLVFWPDAEAAEKGPGSNC